MNMAIMHFLLLLLLFQPSLSSAYTPPDKYFLNCGSKSDAIFGAEERKFIGDAKPSPWSINHGKSKVVRNDTIPNSINEIYHTARAYDEPTWYVFEGINQNGKYVVRLHFFALTSTRDFTRARFNVSASSGFKLLTDFSLENSSDINTPVVKEFAFELEQGGRFGLQFSPLKSSLAFVNAIEVFVAPDDFKPNTTTAVSNELAVNGSFNISLTSNAFQTVYRVTMGGSLITPENDTLWRTWLPDDKFMSTLPSDSMIVTFSGEIQYGTGITIYTAPTYLYSHARALHDPTTTTISSIDPNITWVFKVNKRSKYFLRFHWCDIIEPPKEDFLFNYFIDNEITDANTADALRSAGELGIPFIYEYAYYTDNSGYMKVGIAHNKDLPLSNAFMNGLEIMELIEKSFVGPIEINYFEEGKRNQKGIIIGVCVGGGLIVALIIGLALFYLNKSRKLLKKQRNFPLPQSDPSEKVVSIADLAPNLNNELKISFSAIVAATDDFDEKKIIGVGGFGRVYVGSIGDKEVAIKRSQPGHGQGVKEFQTEVIILSQIRHRFLVSLYGYCDENQEMILVYEYMNGGTLKDYLYGSKTKYYHPLTWQQRLEVCIDAAKGLDYLHTGSTFGLIIHRDIKTTNILLSKDSNAKVADFGISKTGVPNAKEIDTTMKGTYGYLDPEYFNTGQLSEKSDVFAFGVVLLEVLSARPPIVMSLPSEEVNLAEWAVLCKRKGMIEKLIDPFLLGTVQEDSLRKFVELAEKCVDEAGANRPTMHEVVYDLELALQYQFTPVKSGKGYEESTTMVSEPWEIDSGILDRIPSNEVDDSVMMYEGSTTMNAREMVAEFKIDCAR